MTCWFLSGLGVQFFVLCCHHCQGLLGGLELIFEMIGLLLKLHNHLLGPGALLELTLERSDGRIAIKEVRVEPDLVLGKGFSSRLDLIELGLDLLDRLLLLPESVATLKKELINDSPLEIVLFDEGLKLLCLGAEDLLLRLCCWV